MVLVWNLKPGEKRQGWIVRPYRSYAADLPALRKHDWAQEMEQGKKEWRDLLGRASQAEHSRRRRVERLSGLPGAICSSCASRWPTAASSACPAPKDIARATPASRSSSPSRWTRTACTRNRPTAIDLARHAGARRQLGRPTGWGHSMWCGSGFKSWAVMEHYRLTGDKKFLAEVYPRMLASSRWQERQRADARSAGGERPLTYGLMPRGMGDCGLMNDGDMYGVFFPHNIWAVYADRCSLEAAEILGKTDDVAELKKIYETARDDLLAALDRGAIKEKDYRWIPGVPGKTSRQPLGRAQRRCSRADCCRPITSWSPAPCGRSRRTSARAAMPLHTGWMADGMWVAITLDNVAEVASGPRQRRCGGQVSLLRRSTTARRSTPGARNAARSRAPRSARATGSTSGRRWPWFARCATCW